MIFIDKALSMFIKNKVPLIHDDEVSLFLIDKELQS